MKNFLTNINIRKKMIVSHGTIAFLAVMVVAICLLGISRQIGTINKMHSGPVVSSGAVADVSQNIEQISAVVYTTSSTAEESASASQELSGQATSLNGLLDQFRLR